MSSAARAARRRVERAAGASGWQRDYEWQQTMNAVGGWPEGTPRPACWRKGLLAALVGREPVARDGSDPRWHISVQHRDRVPNWQEMAEAAHALRPGVVFVIGVPPRSWWMNVHERVLHLWEMRDDALAGQWQFESRGDEPS